MHQGNIIIGQSGGPTSVINSSLAGVIHRSLETGKFGQVLGMRYGIEGFMNGEMVDLGAMNSSFIKGLRHTPGSALGSSRYKLSDDDLPLVQELFEKYNIPVFFSHRWQ